MSDLEGLTSDERVQLLGAWKLKLFFGPFALLPPLFCRQSEITGSLNLNSIDEF